MEEDIENRVPPTGRAEGQDGKVKGQEHQHLEQKDQRRRMEEKGEEINKAAGAGTGKKSSRLGSLWSIFMHADATDGVLMVLGFLGALGDGLGTPVMLLISSKIMNSLGDSSSALSGGGSAAGFTHDINKNALYLVYLACGTAVSCFLEGYCWTRTGDRQASRMRARYLRAVLRQDVEYFELQSDSTSQVVTSVSSDSLVIQEALADKVPNFIMNATTFFGSYIAAFILTWRLALVATPTLLLLIIPGLMYGRILMDLVRKVRDEYDRAGAIVEQAVSAVRTVYSFVGEGRTMGRFSDALQGPMKLGIKQGLAKGIAIGSNSVTFSIWALMTWYGSKLVMYHGGSGGTIFAAGACIIMGGLSLGSGLSNVKYLSEAASAGERVAQVMNRVPKIDSDDTSGEVLANVVGDVHFKSVEFAYPARPELPILRSFTLHVPAGRTMALVGSSGSGKSTTVALLQRFYDPRRGEVVLDGVDIRKLRLKWLRSQMGLVSQEPALFATTIKENILFGKEDATMEEVVAAAIASNAHKFISQLPQGYDTQVGERGVQMSGGQKQRIAIARAIIRSPKILLLDEATSALDTESERVVQEALDKAAVGRTTIIIAHRLSTIRNADAIAVIQAGKVVELGSHRHLISDREGAYSTLVRLQEQSADAQTSAPKQQHPSMISHGERSSHSLSRRVSSSGGAGLVSRTGSANSFHFMGLQHDIDLEIETEMETELDGATTKEALKSEKKGKSVPSFRRLISMNYPEWKQGIVGLISATLFGAIQPVYALALGSMISVFFLGDHNEIKSQIRTYALVFLALAIFSFTINVGQHYNFGVMGERLTRRVREQMLSKILTFEVAWFDEEGNSTGSICSRLAKDATVVRSLIGDRMALLIQATSAVTVACVMGLVIAWRLALVMIAVQPVIILCFYTRKVLLRSMSGKAIRGQAESCKLAGDAVSNVRTITAFSSQDRILGLFEQSQEGPRRSNVGQAWFAGLVLGAAQGLTHCTWALDFWYGGKLINQGFLNAKQVFQTFMILVSTGRVIAEAGSMATDLAKGADAVASVFQVLDRFTKIEPEDPEGVQPDRSRILGEIEFKDVNFAYPARPEVTIFSGFSLFIESGRSTALVGESGSGKSTIIALAERFYDPLKGSVLIDGRDIRMYHLRALRRHIALVSQEPTLFSGTIRDNIAYGLAAAFDDGDNKDIATAPSQGEIEDAARAANAHDFISSLKDGYDTLCGDKGMQLSGGQKQRIAIARAIIKNPAVLLLDEATSALDSQSESVVQEALDRVMVGRTSVVVAHRLSTVKNCDTIVVLSKGTVIEKGSHSSLLAKGPAGAYYSLVALQQEKKNTQL